jgi:hypothetical protein
LGRPAGRDRGGVFRADRAHRARRESPAAEIDQFEPDAPEAEPVPATEDRDCRQRR